MKFKLPHISIRLPRIKSGLIALVWIVVIGSLMSFVHKKQEARICQRIDVHIQNELGNYFIEDTDVKNLMTRNMRENIENESHAFISLKELENRISQHGFVEKVVVSKDLKGTIDVQVTQYKPMARLTMAYGGDKYISTSGKILPMSDRFTARVMVIEGPYNKTLVAANWANDSLRMPYLNLIRYIHNNSFFNTMIVSAYVHANGELTLLPQIGKQQIDFGLPDNMRLKFEMLQAFYQKIIPVKGWNTYSKVTLKYKNQIVCE